MQIKKLGRTSNNAQCYIPNIIYTASDNHET